MNSQTQLQLNECSFFPQIRHFYPKKMLWLEIHVHCSYISGIVCWVILKYAKLIKQNHLGEVRDRFVSGRSSEAGEVEGLTAGNWLMDGGFMEGPGLTPLIKHSPWSHSNRSLNSSLNSGSLRNSVM